MRLIARFVVLWIAAGIASPAAVFASDVGMVSVFYSTYCPTNWLPLDNSQVPTALYTAEYKAVVNSVPSGVPCTGSSNCYTPDLRGYFFRSLDTSKARDTEFRIVGSSETDQFQGHYHTVVKVNTSGTTGYLPNGAADTGGSGNSSGAVLGGQILAPRADPVNGIPRYGLETRPKNVALLGCVKVKDDVFSGGSTVVPSTFTLVDVSTTAAAQLNPGIWGYFTAGDVSFWFGVLVALVAIWGFKAGGLR